MGAGIEKWEAGKDKMEGNSQEGGKMEIWKEKGLRWRFGEVIVGRKDHGFGLGMIRDGDEQPF